MTDESGESLVKLITGQANLKTLDLTNNRLGCKTAKELANYFKSSSLTKGHLQVFNFSLNSLRDKGCASLCEALSSNTTLHTLDISSNFLSKSCKDSLKLMISKSPGLKNLNISCNPLGVDGGIKILEGIRSNPKIMRVDIRLTGCSRDTDLAIQEALKKNRYASGKRAPSLSTTSRNSSPSGSTTQPPTTPCMSTKKYPFPKI